jgi:hypothetical protein
MSLAQVLEDSSTYQALVAKVLRETLLTQGIDRFGEPELPFRQKLEAICDPSVLRPMTKNLLHVSTWEELLQGK